MNFNYYSTYLPGAPKKNVCSGDVWFSKPKMLPLALALIKTKNSH